MLFSHMIAYTHTTLQHSSIVFELENFCAVWLKWVYLSFNSFNCCLQLFPNLVRILKKLAKQKHRWNFPFTPRPWLRLKYVLIFPARRCVVRTTDSEEFFIVFIIQVSHLCNCVLWRFQFFHKATRNKHKINIFSYPEIFRIYDCVCLSFKRFTGGRQMYEKVTIGIHYSRSSWKSNATTT